MPQDLLEKLKTIQSKATKNSKIIPKLIELKEETNRAFDEHIDHLLSNKGLLKRIKVPKSKLELGCGFFYLFYYISSLIDIYICCNKHI